MQIVLRSPIPPVHYLTNSSTCKLLTNHETCVLTFGCIFYTIVFQYASRTSRKLSFPKSSACVCLLHEFNCCAHQTDIQVDPDDLIKTLHDHPSKAHQHHLNTKSATSTVTPYSSRYASQQEISKFRIPQQGAPSDAVHQMLKDELDLDGRPNLNLASFVGTYMEREAEQLMIENLSKNMSDADEYPAMMAMHARCVSIISHLWGVQKGETAIGSATTGSSEAIHLGGLAMKRRWQEKRDKEGKDKSKPNIIMGSNAQVALEKFARYFEVEARILDVSEKSLYRLDPELVKQNIDENTIGVFVILGSTYTVSLSLFLVASMLDIFRDTMSQ